MEETYGKLILEAILTQDNANLKELVEEFCELVLEQKLVELKKMIAANLYEEQTPVKKPVKSNPNVTKVGRFKIYRARVRGGKVQRRKKISNVKGFTIRGGQLVRMSSTEKQHRRLGAKRAKIKRRSKKAQIKVKFQRALRRRKALGLR